MGDSLSIDVAPPTPRTRAVTTSHTASPGRPVPDVRYAQLKHIPGKRGLPVVGTFPEALMGPLDFAKRMHRRYGPIHRFYASGHWNVQLLGPEANELVLLDKTQTFSSRLGWDPVLGKFFAGGLLMRDFDDHRVQRRYIGVAFRGSLLPGFLCSFQQLVASRVEAWAKAPFDFYVAVRALLLDNAAITFFGLDLGERSREVGEAFDKLVESMTAILPTFVPGSAAAKGLVGKAFLHAFIGEELPLRRGTDRGDLFSQLCNVKDDVGEYLTTDAVARHMVFVLAAAHDTMTAALTAIVWALGTDTKWQDAVRDELAALGDPADLTPEALTKAELTDRVIREGMRLNAPAPILWRRAVKDYAIGGYDVPAGTFTAVNPLMTHRLPEYWARPDSFDPDHFLGEAARARPKFAYIPFGGGPHACLGLHYTMSQAKGFLATLLARHRIVVAPGYKPRWYYWPHAKPLNGLPVTLVPLA